MISVNKSYNLNIELSSFERHGKHIEYRHLHLAEAPWLELESIFKYDLVDFLNERELQLMKIRKNPLVGQSWKFAFLVGLGMISA